MEIPLELVYVLVFFIIIVVLIIIFILEGSGISVRGILRSVVKWIYSIIKGDGS